MDKPPVIYFDGQVANDAFLVLRAMEEREAIQPELATNKVWQSLRQGARDRFANAFQT